MSEVVCKTLELLAENKGGFVSAVKNIFNTRTMATLYLPLKKEWYEMIESGVKTEEYREIKEHWIKRLFKVIDFHFTHYEQICEECAKFYANNVELIKKDFELGGFQPKDYTHIKFSYGYTKRTMSFECKGISIGRGRKEWGAPDNDVFIIKLGKRID